MAHRQRLRAGKLFTTLSCSASALRYPGPTFSEFWLAAQGQHLIAVNSKMQTLRLARERESWNSNTDADLTLAISLGLPRIAKLSLGAGTGAGGFPTDGG